jgi:carboxypeptidase C (cathepsin A)
LFSDITALLNSTYIRKLIKTDVQPVNFTTVSMDVNQAFSYAGDESDVTTTAHLSACSWLENERTSRIIEWSGQAAFASAPMREWEVNGRSVGKVRSSGLLTFATFNGAGHMVRSPCACFHNIRS